jgi:hypothetical protein
MSIRDEINSRVSEGRLFQLRPLIESDEVKRSMFVSEKLFSKLHPEADGPNSFDARNALLRADLERFINGSEITVARNPFKKSKKCYLAPVDPTRLGIWDIRSVDPRPGLRVLGCFSEKDVFVALEMETRESLGGPNDKAWRDFIERCSAHWRRLFGTYLPFFGGETSDYFSENFLDV